MEPVGNAVGDRAAQLDLERLEADRHRLQPHPNQKPQAHRIKPTACPSGALRQHQGKKTANRDAEPKRYRPDFIVRLDDGHDDPLNLIVEVKGYRGEDAKTKKATAEQFWVPGVNANGQFGRWAFVELTEPFTMREEFDRVVTRYLSPVPA